MSFLFISQYQCTKCERYQHTKPGVNCSMWTTFSPIAITNGPKSDPHQWITEWLHIDRSAWPKFPGPCFQATWWFGCQDLKLPGYKWDTNQHQPMWYKDSRRSESRRWCRSWEYLCVVVVDYPSNMIERLQGAPHLLMWMCEWDQSAGGGGGGTSRRWWESWGHQQAPYSVRWKAKWISAR